MLTSSPIISVITPTYNRANELGPLIHSLQNQTLDHSLFELIISDDGSTDDSAVVIGTWMKKVDFELRYLKQDNQGPGAARNHGLAESVGKLIMFIDSDCEAHKSWVETIYKAYQRDEFDACGGPDNAKSDFTRFQKAIDFSMTSFITTGGMRGHSDKMMAKFYPRTHNMAMKKSVYEKIGGFGSLRHGQDIELSHRIHKSGARVKFMKNAIVYHRRRTTLKRFFRQVFNWGVARINLGKIDIAMLEPIHFIPSVVILITIMITTGAFFNWQVYLPVLAIEIGLLLLACLIGGIKNRSILVSVILIMVIPLQIIGYGLGFLIAFISRFIFNRGEFTGFTKKYYL
ncbi:uncharacterized protein METZ01_LOCUS102908 [marine metagenome]|uniref:Glycosyltransferase 2-like domain-containing protein n=1 Tax=marine metagenome TaxID=408172 RepID=A0A381WC57_9ZZZZ